MTPTHAVSRDPDVTTATRIPLLAVRDLAVEFRTARGVARVVDGASWDVAPGETVALVGESGSGKSVSALAVMRLLDRASARIAGGTIAFDGEDLSTAGERRMRGLRGRAMAMVFQEPMTSLNPLMTVGRQIAEPLVEHLGMGRAAARERVLSLLADVGIADAARRYEQYPHHLSGGMRQRVMIAMGLACEPRLLIADEPTTALDVTIQAQILELMQRLARERGIALVVITHNLGIVARYADRVNVMYAGRIVESAPVEALFARPRHPYTISLLRSVPRLDDPRRPKLATIDGTPPNPLAMPTGCRFAPRCAWRIDRCDAPPPLVAIDDRHTALCHRIDEIDAAETIRAVPARATLATATTAVASAEPLVSVRGLGKRFDLGPGQAVRAVDDVSFEIRDGETLGLVGESGCGKTTVGRMILGLTDATTGDIRFRGRSIVGSGAKGADHREIQVVFQDPFGSLNPRMTVGDILSEPLRVHRMVPRNTVSSRVDTLLDQVGLPATLASRYPHQLSGGQRQRVGIARALTTEPAFVVLDEPVSALDVSVQGQIVNLLADLQRDLGIGYLFIAHDLAVVRHLSHRVVVMYLGHVMESAGRDALYERPLHPYTRALLDAAPIPDPARRAEARPTLGGELPSPLAPPSGCVFRTRCPRASAECADVIPALREVRPDHFVACIKV